MVRITGINRRVDVDKGGVASDEVCHVVMMVSSDETVNKAKFKLTEEEAEKLDFLAKVIEKRIGELLTDDYTPPEPKDDAQVSTE